MKQNILNISPKNILTYIKNQKFHFQFYNQLNLAKKLV